MSLRKLTAWGVILVSTLLLAVSWFTVTFVLAADGDADSGDADKFSGLSALLIVVAVTAVGWFAYQRQSTKSR